MAVPIGSFQVTRRACLQTLAAGVTLWPACLRGTEISRPKLSLLIISDTHLGYKDQDSAAKQWEKTAAALREAPGDLVLHLGDVVDGGREAQYPVYLNTREKIGKPVYEIPGNHDPSELFQKHLRRQIDTAIDHHWLKILLLGNAHTDSHDGFLTDEQNAWIAKQCEAAAQAGQFVIVCMHVPAHANDHPDRGWYVHPDAGQTKLYETLDEYRDRVLALWHGHFHNGIRGWTDRGPLQETLFPSALYNLDRRLAEQQAPGYNLLEFRPGFTQVTIDGEKLELQYVPVGHAEEAAVKELTLSQLSSK
jgi:calcineurin-like phosphoesterase family protein